MKNNENVVTVDKERHAKTRIQANRGLVHAKEFNMASITLREIGPASANFPVVFINNQQTNKLRPVVLLGFDAGENLFYGEDFWSCTYIPLMILRHPFIIGFDDREPDSNNVTTCLETDSPFVNETEGEALFDDKGEQTDYLKNQMRVLAEMFQGEKLTEEFITTITELDLITEFNLLLYMEDGAGKRMTGMQTIDEKKLRVLSDEQLAVLVKKDYLAPIYFMLNSFYQIHQLIKLRNATGSNKINGYQIEMAGAAAEQAAPAV